MIILLIRLPIIKAAVACMTSFLPSPQHSYSIQCIWLNPLLPHLGQHYIQTFSLTVMMFRLKSSHELHFNRNQVPLNPLHPVMHRKTHQETTPQCSRGTDPFVLGVFFNTKVVILLKKGVFESSSVESVLRHFASLLRSGRGKPPGETNSKKQRGGPFPLN